MTMVDAADVGLDFVLGTAQICGPYGVLRMNDKGVDPGRAEALLAEATQLGVAALDTAPAYDGAESAIGGFISPLPVHTKIAPALAPADSLASSLARLHRTRVEVLYLHDSTEVLNSDSAVIAEAYRFVGDSVELLGASVYEIEEFDAAVADPRIRVIQVPLSIFDRRVDEARLKAAAERGVRVYARSVLLQGTLLASPASLVHPVEGLRPFVDNLHRVAELFGRPTIEVALGWVRAQRGVRGLVVGAESVEQLRALVTAFRSDPLTPAELSELRRLEVPPPPLSDPRRWDLACSTAAGQREEQPRVVAIVQARLSSMRFPRKVLAPVLGRPILSHLLERLGRATRVDEIVLAIPDSPAGDALVQFADEHGVRYHRGSEDDVLDRYHRAAQGAGAAVVVRITGDCPMVDPALVDRAVSTLVDGGYDYVQTGRQYPDGFDVEVMTMAALQRASGHASDRYDREHVTPYVQRDPSNRVAMFDHVADLSGGRVTLDEPEDLEVIAGVFEAFGHNRFTFEDVAALMLDQPALFAANRHVHRDEGATMCKGEKLWRRAKRVIPGGSMLLSKRAEMHLPVGWPAYFSRASGCRVWDLDDNEFIDVGLMGVGTNILGYGHPKVDEAVRRVVDAGNLSTLNCPEEVALAEALLELHPWADMARFTRSGGEACAVAVRIARAAAGRDGVAFCGYHGWHDWYLSANLAEESALDGHLLPGLDPVGVPRGLSGSARPFPYNDLAALESLLERGDVGAVFMEVQRSMEPATGFLEGVRTLATRHGAALVFDECTSGFRKNLGGLHLFYGIEPDIAVFGKTLGNGYAVNAVIGREEVMQAAHNTFISSTFWTERIGSAAALASLAAMSDEDAPARIDAIGLAVRQLWSDLAAEASLPIQTSGLPALGGFTVKGLDPIAVKTFVTQELLKNGFLGGTSLYASVAHESAVLQAYAERLRPVFAALASCETSEQLFHLLPHGPAQRGFQRLA